MRNQKPHKQIAAIIVIVCGLTITTSIFGLINSAPARAAVGINKQINFQGKLVNTNGTNIADNTYNLRFRLYDASTSGVIIWTEDRLVTNGQGVTTSNGIFQVNLGSVCTLAGGVCGANTNSAVDFNSDSLYLTINIGSTASVATFALASGNGEMSPRVQFTAAPYAFNTDKLDGLDANAFTQLGQTSGATGQTDASTNSSLYVNKTSTGNLVELQKNGVDAFNVSNTGDVLFGQNADHSMSVIQTSTNAAGHALTITAGQGGTGASANAGGNLVLQAGAGGGTNGAGGMLQLSGGAGVGSGGAGGVLVKNTADSTNAFQIQDSNGFQPLNVDTLTTLNLVTNPGFEVNTTGWSNKNGSGTSVISRITTQQYNGVSSLQIVTSGTATNAGATFTTGASFLTNQQYTLSFFAKANGSSFATLDMGYSATGASDTSCLTAQTVVTGGWTRYTCTFTAAGTGGTPYIYLKQTDATPRTFYIDGVQLETGAVATAYNPGSQIALRGVINSPISFKSGSDSTNAFNIQSSAGTNLFNVDSLNLAIKIGGGDVGPDASPVLLVLDTKNTTGDPATTINGAMYYNSSLGKFRCYESGAWGDCITHHRVVLANDVINSNATANTIADVTGLSFAVTNGTVYNFQCNILYTAALATTGSRWAVNGPANTALIYTSEYSLSATTSTRNGAVIAYDSPAASATASASTGSNLATISGMVKPSANGTIIVRFASEIASSAITAKAGSTCEWW